MTTTQLAFVSAVAAEIDRLVVRGHELAHDYPDKPQALSDMTAFPALLNTAAIVLLTQPLTRDDFKGIVPYTPASLIDALIANNIEEHVVTDDDGRIVLTDTGRILAEALVGVQEDSVARAWSAAGDDVRTIERVLGPMVERAATLVPLRTPSNFALFAPHRSRSTIEGSVLRLVTAVRYWRADAAHLRAIDDAGLDRPEAHALTRLWDAHRGVERIGQGFPNSGRKAVASLEQRGLAEGGMITGDGIDVRERIEEETDRLTAPLYDEADEPSRNELLRALRALPGDAAPGIPGT
jgi:hypothetical protein